MAFRTWAKLLGATLGVAALAGASQLGVAYGLGILRLTRVLDEAARDQWVTQLAWVAWLAMMAAVLGGLAGGWLRDRWQAPAGVPTAVGLAVAAGVGAAVVVPLTMQPARTAQIAGVRPVVVIGVCAALGAVVGMIAAYAALAEPVARWSLGLVGATIWVIALISVAPSLAPSDPLPAVRLGVFDAGFLDPGVTQRTALFTMPAVALLAGAALGWAARRRGMPTLTIALAGLPGAALLTLSYLIAGPGSGGERYQVVPYWAAMTATGAGVLGSVLAAVLRRGGEPEQDGEPADRTGESGAGTPRVPDQRGPSDGSGRSQEGGAPDRTGVPADRHAGAADRTAAWLKAKTDPLTRRSSAADAFTSRTGEWAGRRSDTAAGGVALGEYADDDPEPFDAFRKPAAPPPVEERRAADPEPYVPAPALRPLPPEAIQQPASPPPAGSTPAGAPYGAAAEAPSPAPPPRRSGLRGRITLGRNRGRGGSGGFGSGGGGAGGRNPTWPGRAPLPDAPARSEPPYDAPPRNEPPRDAPPRNEPPRDAPPRSEPPRDAPPRNEPLRDAPFGRGPLREAPPGRGPLVPEPEAISAPLPQPQPITPPLPVTPAPDDTRRGRKRRRDEEDFVDWVNGLGGQETD